MIQLKSVTKRYPGVSTDAVSGLDLHIKKGELLILLGESGCGKTTTLKMINRLIEPTRGEILIDGQNVLEMDPVELRRGIGYVFQGVGLFPHMTVAQNIAIVPRLLSWPDADIRSRADTLLDMVGLPPDHYRDRYPTQLSGGQRQRIGVIRALAAKPGVMLLDEPFGALDPITRDELQRDFKAIQAELGLTAVMVTHDMTEALLMASRIAVMKNGELVGLGTPRQMLTEPPDAHIGELMAMPQRQAERIEALLEGGVS